MVEWTIECTPTIINVKKEPLIVEENETTQTQYSKMDGPPEERPVTVNSRISRKLSKNGLDIPLTKKPRVAPPRISEDERSVSSRPSTPLSRSSSRSSKKKSVVTKDKIRSKLSLITFTSAIYLTKCYLIDKFCVNVPSYMRFHSKIQSKLYTNNMFHII